MIGDRYTSDGIEFEVVWSGGEGLSANRETKADDFWTAPPRIYNKKSDYWLKSKKLAKPVQLKLPLDIPYELSDDEALEDYDGKEVVLRDS